MLRFLKIEHFIKLSKVTDSKLGNFEVVTYDVQSTMNFEMIYCDF